MFQQAITNFNISYDVYNDSRTFASGDRVTGKISFKLKKQTKISQISMEFRGMVHVHWSTSGGQKRRRRQHSAQLDYFHLKSSILQENSGMPPEGSLHQSCTLNCWRGKMLSVSSCSSSWRTQTSAWHACISIYASDSGRVCTSMLLSSCAFCSMQAWLLKS